MIRTKYYNSQIARSLEKLISEIQFADDERPGDKLSDFADEIFSLGYECAQDRVEEFNSIEERDPEWHSAVSDVQTHLS